MSENVFSVCLNSAYDVAGL